jgi:putative drug exporter of the RND superfamily
MTPSESQDSFASPDLLAAADGVRAAVEGLPNVIRASEPLVSPDGRVALVRVQYPPLLELTAADAEALRDVGVSMDAEPLQVEMGGDLFFAFSEPQTGVGELVGLGIAAVILFLAFGSLIATALPIGMAITGLAVGTGVITLLANFTDVPTWAPILGAMVGLGVGIDYALFIVTRHRANLAAGMTVEDSVAHALSTAGQPVIFAGGIVVVSILGLAVSGVPFMTSGGIAVSIIVLTMVAISLSLLPALLGLAGPRINGLRRTSQAASPVSLGWQRWLRHVTRHAGWYAVGVAALLLALAAPLTALRVGIPDDGALPTDRTERRAYDLIADGFGAGANAPAVVAVDLSDLPADLPANELAATLDPLQSALAADLGVASVSEPQVFADAGVATFIVTPTSGPQDRETREMVDRLRSDVIPAALGDSSLRAHVGGQTASFADVGDRVNERLPWFILAVLAMSFVFLALIFRSVVVPLKAVLLNLLAIGASYGVLVMLFQWGWGADLIGLEATVPIVSYIPMFMFAILFGLSMDYEVFLLSRVREEYLVSGNNEESIIQGIASTARVITSAALIMVAVFGAFVFGPDAGTKMFGIGLATAILIDATLIRMVLVPATMTLLGDANWWLPGWLREDRWAQSSASDAQQGGGNGAPAALFPPPNQSHRRVEQQ